MTALEITPSVRCFIFYYLSISPLLLSLAFSSPPSFQVPRKQFPCRCVLPCRASRSVDVMFFVEVEVAVAVISAESRRAEFGFSSCAVALMTSAPQSNANEPDRAGPPLRFPRNCDGMPCHDPRAAEPAKTKARNTEI